MQVGKRKPGTLKDVMEATEIKVFSFVHIKPALEIPKSGHLHQQSFIKKKIVFHV